MRSVEEQGIARIRDETIDARGWRSFRLLWSVRDLLGFDEANLGNDVFWRLRYCRHFGGRSGGSERVGGYSDDFAHVLIRVLADRVSPELQKLKRHFAWLKCWLSLSAMRGLSHFDKFAGGRVFAVDPLKDLV